MQRNLLHPGNAWDWWEHCVCLCDDEQGWREQELLQSEVGTVGGVVRCDSGELLCQRSLWGSMVLCLKGWKWCQDIPWNAH